MRAWTRATAWADAQRNIEALLRSARAVFAITGVDARVREIAEKAGVGTVYRHFPQRADLIVAVFRHEVDACADAAAGLTATHEPGEALALWMQRYVDFIAAKRGLAIALHSGSPAFDILPAYVDKRLRPALHTLLKAAAAAGEVRAVGIDDYAVRKGPTLLQVAQHRSIGLPLDLLPNRDADTVAA